MKNTKYYLAMNDDGDIDFYPRTKDGLNDMASLYNNKTCRFFEVIVEREVEINYGLKTADKGEMPHLNEYSE